MNTNGATNSHSSATRHGDITEYLDHCDGIEELAEDLTGDLCHLLHQAGLDPEPILQRGHDHPLEELADHTATLADQDQEEA